MASKTTNYGLNKHSPQDFYNVEARNENWDKIDAELKNNVDAVNARVKTAELAAEVKKVVKDGSLTAADLGAEKAGAAAALEKKMDALGAGDVGADPTGTAANEVSTHNTSTSAHSAQFAKKQDKIKGKKGKYLGFTANDTVGEVDAPASGGSRITLTFAADFVGQAWTLSGGGEQYTGTVVLELLTTVHCWKKKALLSWSKKAVNISGLRSLILHRRQEFWNAISMKPIFPYKMTTVCVYTIWSCLWGKL